MQSSYLGDKVYGFTNENLTSYESIYDFEGANVVSVLGSGDQYFSSILFGAKDVLLFDCNPSTWSYFILKFYAIQILSYEEFKDLFVTSKLSNEILLKKIEQYLPNDVFLYFKRLACLNKKLSEMIIYSVLSFKEENFNSGRIIPYFDENNYYKLQELLNNRKLPTFYVKSLENLDSILDKRYDILLASNIYNWLPLEPYDYKILLKQLPVDIIQALYIWRENHHLRTVFEDLGFFTDIIPSVSIDFDMGNNVVMTLKK